MVSWVVKVKPGAFKDEVVLDEEGNVVIRIRERPIDGAANNYLVQFLAKEFNLRKSDIKIEKGLTSRYKKIVLNITESELEKIVKKYK